VPDEFVSSETQLAVESAAQNFEQPSNPQCGGQVGNAHCRVGNVEVESGLAQHEVSESGQHLTAQLPEQWLGRGFNEQYPGKPRVVVDHPD
jgi:hypothetical protein